MTMMAIIVAHRNSKGLFSDEANSDGILTYSCQWKMTFDIIQLTSQPFWEIFYWKNYWPMMKFYHYSVLFIIHPLIPDCSLLFISEPTIPFGDPSRLTVVLTIIQWEAFHSTSDGNEDIDDWPSVVFDLCLLIDQPRPMETWYSVTRFYGAGDSDDSHCYHFPALHCSTCWGYLFPPTLPIYHTFLHWLDCPCFVGWKLKRDTWPQFDLAWRNRLVVMMIHCLDRRLWPYWWRWLLLTIIVHWLAHCCVENLQPSVLIWWRPINIASIDVTFYLAGKIPTIVFDDDEGSMILTIDNDGIRWFIRPLPLFIDYSIVPIYSFLMMSQYIRYWYSDEWYGAGEVFLFYSSVPVIHWYLMEGWWWPSTLWPEAWLLTWRTSIRYLTPVTEIWLFDWLMFSRLFSPTIPSDPTMGEYSIPIPYIGNVSHSFWYSAIYSIDWLFWRENTFHCWHCSIQWLPDHYILLREKLRLFLLFSHWRYRYIRWFIDRVLMVD